MNNVSNASNEEEVQPKEAQDPITALLFLTFIGSFAYLLIGSSVGVYPWIIIVDQILFIPTWEAVITFLAIFIIMFVTLIAGLVRMRYSIIIVGIVTLTAVFLFTFYAMLLIGALMVLQLP